MATLKSKRVPSLVILHGYAETPDKVWLPWIHHQAEDAGWRVWAPHLPNPLKPEIAAWMKAIREQSKRWDNDTIIIGHSLGGVLALRALAAAPRPGLKVRSVVLVASPFAAMVPVRQLVNAFSHPIDWARLRQRAESFTVIHSRNDPLVPFDHAYRYKEALGAKIVLTAKDGHFIGRQAQAVWREIEGLAG